MSIKITIPNSSSDVLTFGSGNTPTAAQIAGIDSGSSNGQLALYTTASGTSTERVRINASGNVGIGIAADERLTVSISNPTDGRVASLRNSGTSSLTGTKLWFNQNTVDNWNIGQPAGVNAFVFCNSTGSTNERMRIDSSGNLLVGGTTPYIAERITARAASASVQCISAYNTFNSQSAANIYSASVTASSSGWYHFIGQSGNGTGVTTNNIIIYGNGNVQNANNSYTGISDIKLKENVVDATPKLAKLMQVRVVNYNLKAEDGYEAHKQIGVVAQELEQIFPGMVEETADKDMQGEDLGTTTKSVKYSVFVPMLIKALQEQQAIIQTLTDRITALENK